MEARDAKSAHEAEVVDTMRGLTVESRLSLTTAVVMTQDAWLFP